MPPNAASDWQCLFLLTDDLNADMLLAQVPQANVLYNTTDRGSKEAILRIILNSLVVFDIASRVNSCTPAGSLILISPK